jgi:hypothetical protein
MSSIDTGKAARRLAAALDAYGVQGEDRSTIAKALGLEGYWGGRRARAAGGRNPMRRVWREPGALIYDATLPHHPTQ